MTCRGPAIRHKACPSGTAKSRSNGCVALQTILGILEQRDPSLEYSIYINFLDVAQQSSDVAHTLLLNPRQGLDLLDEAISQAQEVVAEDNMYNEDLLIKSHLRIRLSSLPFYLDSANPGIGGIRIYHTGRLITLAGTVVKTGPIQTMEAVRHYECTKCRHRWALLLYRGSTKDTCC
jgi:DNA helicase MCM9